MGACCSGPESGAYDSDRSGMLKPSLRSNKNHNGTELERAVSLVPNLPDTSRPRVHRNRTAEKGRLAAEERMVPLKECSDAMLLAELDHRNIRLHERVTENLVSQRYKFGKLLGQGSSATVFEAKHKKTGREVAIKVIKKDDDMNDDESMATELEILKTVHHRYILNCHEIFETPQCIWVVMEIIRGGELLEVLSEGGVYEEADAARAMKQAFLAISYLHSQGVVHRDLKLQNMLLTEKERTSDLKVGDFGLSAQIARGALDWGDKDAVKAYHGLSEKWGTPHYFAPEMLWKAYGPQVDMWALGVVLFQLLCGKYPFYARNNKELFYQIERSPEHLRKQFDCAEWDAVSDVAKDLVKKLLNPDPKKRLNADEALQHEWIVLRGQVGGGGDLKTAQKLLKQQVAEKRLTALWHVLDIMNAVDASAAGGSRANVYGANYKASRSPKQLPPMLAKKAMEASSSSLLKGQPPPLSKGVPGSPTRNRVGSTTDRIEELQYLFNLFDTDRNGTIDEEEMMALFKKLGFEPRRDKLRAIVKQVDTDASGTLEFPEFCEFLKRAKQSEALGGGGGLGIGTAVEAQLNSLAGDDNGHISSTALIQYLHVVAESSGQALSQTDIDDVIALSDDFSGEGASVANVRDAMIMTPTERKTLADKRRTEASQRAVSVAYGSHNSQSQ